MTQDYDPQSGLSLCCWAVPWQRGDPASEQLHGDCPGSYHHIPEGQDHFCNCLCHIPQSWLDQELLQTLIPGTIPLRSLLTIHGAVVLALKHPEIGAGAVQEMLGILDGLEECLEGNGLEPPIWGWRRDLNDFLEVKADGSRPTEH